MTIRIDTLAKLSGIEQNADARNVLAQMVRALFVEGGDGDPSLSVLMNGGTGIFATPTAGTLTVDSTRETGAGSTAANSLTTSISNIGAVKGTINTGNGVRDFEPGETINLVTTWDRISNEIKQVPAVTFDATGTIFSITVTS